MIESEQVLNNISLVHDEKLNEMRSPGNQTEMLRLVVVGVLKRVTVAVCTFSRPNWVKDRSMYSLVYR